LSTGGPPASMRRTVFISDLRSMGTPDTWLAQDGHYALPGRILKAARLSAACISLPLVLVFWESAPCGRRPWF
jgi:hypothetical protein